MVDKSKDDIDAMVDEAMAQPDLGHEPDLVANEEPAEIEAPIEAAPADPLEELKVNLAAEKAARAEAEKREKAEAERAAKAEHELTGTRGQAQASEIQKFGVIVDHLKKEQADAKRNWSLAMQQGDYDKAADFQTEMVTHTTNLRDAEAYKARLEHQAKQPQRQQASADPVEALARQVASAGSPRSADWIRKHPEVATDEALRNEMLAAHHRAVRAGHQPESDAYFAFVEDRLGMGDAPMFEAAKPAAPIRRPPVAAAPVTRSAPAGNVNGQQQKINITRGQLEAGRAMGLSDAEIIASARQLQKEGMLN